MGFMEEYKSLDRICKDMNGIGISGYISEMEMYRKGVLRIPSWKDDYYGLKHYRWVRNQIAHEVDETEENMCDCEDREWIKDFHQRLLGGEDPLTQYRRLQDIPHHKVSKETDVHCYKRGGVYYLLLIFVMIIVFCLLFGKLL